MEKFILEKYGQIPMTWYQFVLQDIKKSFVSVKRDVNKSLKSFTSALKCQNFQHLIRK